MKKDIFFEKDKNQIYKTDLKILLNIKKSVGLLNNAIHDKAALLAINILEKKYPSFKFIYRGAGVGDLDIIGKERGRIKLIAEIKTTTIENRTSLMGPQLRSIKKDLVRLKKRKAKYKYLILISEKVEKNIKRRLDFEKEFKDIEIMTVF